MTFAKVSSYSAVKHVDRSQPAWQTYGVGFLANVCGLLTFILAVYLCLATVAIFYTTVDALAKARVEQTPLANGSLTALITASFLGTIGNALAGLWDARWGFVLLGILGVFAAWAHQLGLLLDAKRAWLVSFVCMATVISVLAITWSFVQREQIALWMAESPELFRWRDMLMRSYATDLSVSLIFALTLTYPLWTVWRWWYRHLSAWFGLDSLEPAFTLQQATPEQSDFRAYGQRLQALKQQSFSPSRLQPAAATVSTPNAVALPQRQLILPLAILFCTSLLFLYPIQQYHNQVALRFQHGTAFVNAADQAEQTFPLRIEAGSRKIRIVNINGLGTVDVLLERKAVDQKVVGRVEAWSFAWREDEYLYSEIPVTDVAPGDYSLRFIQQTGWGWFEYTLSHGGGPVSHLLALVTGLLMACCLVAGVGLCVLVIIKK